MEKNNRPELDVEKEKEEALLRPLESAEELQNWIELYLDLKFPMGTVHPESTHGPIDAMWEIYTLMKTGESAECPQVTMLASRDSFKTLGAAALEVLCMLHFRLPVAHMAAIKSQAAKAIQYVNSFFRKLRPYLEANGWRKSSDSKTYIEWITDLNETVYLNIISCTIAGANSEHVPMLFIDEVDVVRDPRALKEAKMIPSVFGGYFPLTIYLSTRKFAGGLMEKTLKETLAAGGKILRWNILDVAERISHEMARVDEPKVVRYISRELPMQNLSPEEWALMNEESQNNFERFEAYAGIAEHRLLSVMRNNLVNRKQDDYGGLYKPLVAILNNFRQIPVDMADAQLLCNKPSSSGLVYPRFIEDLNVLTPKQALEKIMGEEVSDDIPNYHEYLVNYLMDLGIPFIGGGDWGYTDFTSLIMLALLPSGEVWLLDALIEDKLELDDIVKYACELQRNYEPEKWWVDQNYPAYLKTLRRKGVRCPKFKKVVEDGIAALQGKIVDSSNTRRFFIIRTPNTVPVIDAFGEYRWALDGKGDIIEGKPYHGTDGTSDIMDSIRYPFQCLFTKGGVKPSLRTATGKKKGLTKPKAKTLKEAAKDINKQIMSNKIVNLAKEGTAPKRKAKNKKRILWM